MLSWAEETPQAHSNPRIIVFAYLISRWADGDYYGLLEWLKVFAVFLIIGAPSVNIFGGILGNIAKIKNQILSKTISYSSLA